MLPTTNSAKVEAIEIWFRSHPALGNVSPIDHLFNQLDGLYPQRWRSSFANEQAIENWRNAWTDAIVSEGLTKDEIRAGLAACRSRFKWPPSFAEFFEACRPPLNYEAAYAEAVKQTRLRDEGRDEWSSAAVFWAAVEFGTFDLRILTYASAKGRWAKCLDDAIKAVRDGSKPDQVPQRLAALPAPGETTIPPEEAKRRIAEMAATLAGSKAMPK